MRHYEIIFMIRPDKGEYIQDLISNFNNIVKKLNGNIHRFEDWGLRHLAYQIEKLHKAHYFLLNIEISTKGIKEIKKFLVLSEIVIRSMIICVKNVIKDPSIVATQMSEQKNFESNISILEKEEIK